MPIRPRSGETWRLQNVSLLPVRSVIVHHPSDFAEEVEKTSLAEGRGLTALAAPFEDSGFATRPPFRVKGQS